MAQSIEEILTPETGRILKQAREARGLSIADVSARLRLNAAYISSMESGDLTPLPPGPYRKAFISEYAKFLNIKLDELHGKSVPQERSEGRLSSAVSAVPGVAKKVTQSAVKTTESAFKKVEEGVKDAVEEITARDLWEEADEVRKERLGIKQKIEDEPRISIRKKDIIPEPDESAPPPFESRRARRLEFEQSTFNQDLDTSQEKDEEPRPGLSRTTKLIVGVLLVFAVIIGYSIYKKDQPTTAIPVEEKVTVKPPEHAQKPATPIKKEEPVAANVAPADSLIFIITAKDSVWVSVTPDIGTGFRGKLTKGEVKRFTAKDKYFLFLGNQKAVTMTLDGKPITNLPTVPGSNIVVRNAVLTRDKISLNTPAARIIPHERTSKKNKKTPQIKKRIPSVNPVLPR